MGKHNFDRYAGKSRTAADISQRQYLRRQHPRKKEGVEEVFYDNILVGLEPGKVIGPVPLFQLFKIREKRFDLLSF
jgi:hypothetical protein